MQLSLKLFSFIAKQEPSISFSHRASLFQTPVLTLESSLPPLPSTARAPAAVYRMLMMCQEHTQSYNSM